MRSLPRRFAVVAVLVAGALGVAACVGGSPASKMSASGPVSGGTLRFVAASGPDHLDTVSAYGVPDYMLERAYARQLVAYPFAVSHAVGDAGWKRATTPVPDVAAALPAISNGGTTYTFRIRRGVRWNTTPPRQVTSQDFLREFKAFFNPVSPVGAPEYFTATIKGLLAYQAAEFAFFASKSTKPTAANIANFANTHTIAGIATPNSSTIVFTLIHPAADFIDMLAMPFASARPAEYDRYVPDSAQFRQHTISDGPYQITSYVPGKSLVLSKNPAWQQAADPIRHQYVSKITVTTGVPSAATQLADEKAGAYDLVNDTPFEPTAIPQLRASHDPKFAVWPWSNTFPYIVFNLRSPDAGHAMGKLQVRRAFEYGVDKVAAQKAFGGPAVTKILNSVIPPGNTGYVSSNTYPDNNGAGNTAKCQSALASAGYPHGLTVTALYANDSVDTKLFEAVQASLMPCGVNLAGKPEPASSYFTDLGNAPANNQPGQWDVAFPGWIPDWFGNNGRAIIPALFQTNCVINTSNYGCVSNATMDTLIKQAEAAASQSQAGSLWAQANTLAMRNAWIVPLLDQLLPYYSSSRVDNPGSPAVAFQPNIGGPDVTNVWLNPNTP